MNSPWVKTEILRARKRETEENREKDPLIPNDGMNGAPGAGYKALGRDDNLNEFADWVRTSAEGTADHSPAFQRWVGMIKRNRVPSGAAQESFPETKRAAG